MGLFGVEKTAMLMCAIKMQGMRRTRPIGLTGIENGKSFA